jgi:hypothetical protein
MRPLTDLLNISREKLAFIVDGTSAPVASITPISAWIGFEIGLIQAELNTIFEKEDPDTIRISGNGLEVFLESVKYRYCKLYEIPCCVLNHHLEIDVCAHHTIVSLHSQIPSSCFCSCPPSFGSSATMVSKTRMDSNKGRKMLTLL